MICENRTIIVYEMSKYFIPIASIKWQGTLLILVSFQQSIYFCYAKRNTFLFMKRKSLDDERYV